MGQGRDIERVGAEETQRTTQGKLIEGGAICGSILVGEDPGTEQTFVLPTLEQVEEIRGEMNESFKQTVEDAVVAQDWEVVQKYAGMLARESAEKKLPEITDIGEIPGLVKYHISPPNERKEVKETLEEVEKILGSELSSYYELSKLTYDEFNHLSEFLKRFYNNEGDLEKDFQKNLHDIIKEYIPKIFDEDWREDPFIKRQKQKGNNWVKVIPPFKGAIKEKDKKTRKRCSKEICKLIVNDMRDNDEHSIFVNKITDKSGFLKMLEDKPMKIFITEYALYTRPKGRRSLEELKICLDNTAKLTNYIERLQIPKTEELEKLFKEINGRFQNLREKPKKNTARNREGLMECLEKCLETIAPIHTHTDR